MGMTNGPGIHRFGGADMQWLAAGKGSPGFSFLWMHDFIGRPFAKPSAGHPIQRTVGIAVYSGAGCALHEPPNLQAAKGVRQNLI